MMKAILVVDSDAAVGALLAEILEVEGHKVTVAQSLLEAVKLLSLSRFDLIISEAFGQAHIFDFDPVFLAQLRSSARSTPIFLCSTYPSTDYLRPGDFGLAGIVPKPFEIDDLVRKVSNILG